MAYFSCGTDFEAWQHNNCRTCIHEPEPDGQDCAILTVHSLYNYAQFPEHNKHPKRAEAIKVILGELIPVDGLHAGKCRMWREKTG